MRCLINIVAVLVLASCSQSHRISQRLHEMESVPVKVDYSKMTCWLNDSLLENRPWESEKGMKLISFTDSSLCSVCNIKKMYLWNKILDLETQYEGFNVFLILGVKQGMTSYISTQLYQSGITHPIYIDESQSLLTQNPQIPEESMYHTFLLDEDNNVLLVGNPTAGENMEKIMLEVLDSRLKKRVIRD